MKLQNDSFSCGIYAIINAAKCFDIHLTKKDVVKYSNTTRKNGTSEKGIIRALKNNNFNADDFKFFYKTCALKKINEELENSNPVIISVDNDNHWCVLVGTLGKKYIVFDSDGAKYNKLESGIQLVTVSDLVERWANRNKEFYCIIVSKQKKENTL
jgi:ABC-type bacteriocin/lantibiotic exporter with double-glycine peptidase domain